MSYQLPPKYQRYADRLRELIEEGKEILEMKTSNRGDISNQYYPKVKSWSVKSGNVIEMVCGNSSVHFSHFEELEKNEYSPYWSKSYHRELQGILHSASSDLENGFLLNREFLIAVDILDNVLEQALTLLDAGYKDPAAMLCRVVLEDALKRLARASGISDVEDKKTSQINQELRSANAYNKTQWRQITTWLDYGNDAAHGNFETYTETEVQNMIDGIESFLATYLSI